MDEKAIALVESEADVRPEVRCRALFDAHHELVYRVARRMVSNPDEALDLVQETFLRALRSARSAPTDLAGGEAWLIRILTNLSRDRWRRLATRRQFEQRYREEVEQQSAPRVDVTLLAHELVWQALYRLAPRRRMVLVLHELEGIEVPRIAHLLGLSAITVRWHLSRGRQELAKAMTHREWRQS